MWDKSKFFVYPYCGVQIKSFYFHNCCTKISRNQLYTLDDFTEYFSSEIIFVLSTTSQIYITYIYVHSIYHIKYKHCGMIRPWIIHYHEVWKEYYRVYKFSFSYLGPRLDFSVFANYFGRAAIWRQLCMYVFKFFRQNGLTWRYYKNQSRHVVVSVQLFPSIL